LTLTLPKPGVKLPTERDILLLNRPCFAKTTIQPSVVNYVKLLPPVQYQGIFGTCNVHAGVAALYAYYQSYYTQRTASLLYSRRALYTQTKYTYERTDIRDDGIFLVDMMQAMTTFGSVYEVNWVYPTGTDFSPFLLKVPNNLWKPAIKKWTAIIPNLRDIKAALNNYGPLISAITVPQEWYVMSSFDNGMLPIPGVQTKPDGGHSVLICGYDDDKQALLIRNSWGTQWGDGGYAWIPYAVGSPKKLVGWPFQCLAITEI
jgi:C1A family cysteine protease